MSEAMVKIFIDRAGVDEMFELDLSTHVAIIGVKSYFNFWMCQNLAEHRRVSVLRQGLKLFRQIAVVAVSTNRNATTNTSVEISCLTLPLLARVVFEKHFVQLPPDLGNNHLLRVLRIGNIDAPRSQLR